MMYLIALLGALAAVSSFSLKSSSRGGVTVPCLSTTVCFLCSLTLILCLYSNHLIVRHKCYTHESQRQWMAGFGKKAEKVAEVVAPSGDSLCSCESKKTYAECCHPLHAAIGVKVEGEGPEPTKVLRARFSALRYEMPQYLVASTHPNHKDYVGTFLPFFTH